MSRSVKSILEELEENDELEHYGVLGMRWGVRKDRRTGRIKGKPIKGTEKATREGTAERRRGEITQKPRSKSNQPLPKNAQGENLVKTRSGREVPIKMDQRQKTKFGQKRSLDLNDFSIEQLKSMSERFRLENDLVKILDGPTSEEDMQRVVNRIKLEQEYNRLTASPPTARQRVNSRTKELLRRGGNKVLDTAVDGAATYVAHQLLESLGIKPSKNNNQNQKKKK